MVNQVVMAPKMTGEPDLRFQGLIKGGWLLVVVLFPVISGVL